MSSPETIPPARRGRSVRMTACAAVLLVGLAVWVSVAAGTDAPRAWRAMLINFLYFTALGAGLVTWSAVVLLANGRWTGPTERWALAGLALAPVSLAALAALWLGREHWAVFLHTRRPDQAIWLDGTFVFVRNALALAVLWALAWAYVRRRRRGRPVVLAGGLVLAYCLVLTLEGFDLVMALDVQWYSALLGGYYFTTGMYIALCAWTVASVLSRSADESRRHDLGKLIVAFGLIATYLMFSQLLPIWFENLPREARFVLPRLRHDPWRWVSAALLATVYLGPPAALLTVRAKRSAPFLACAALALVAGLWVERWWLVTPTVNGPLALGLAEISLTAAFAAAAAFGLKRLAGRIEPVLPEGKTGQEPSAQYAAPGPGKPRPASGPSAEPERPLTALPAPARSRRTWLPAVLGLSAGGLIVAVALAYYFYFPSRLGPPQPIAFSHRFHAADKRISCVFCHAGALDSPRAGAPPLETCMLCHEQVIITHPQIVELRQAYSAGRPIEWAKVSILPEYTYFDHEAHLRRRVDCGRCHGDVRAADRLERNEFKMGFCVQCHRDHGVSHDCLICHR